MNLQTSKHPFATTGWVLFFMTENYDDLIWEIDDLPIGSSTPDDLFELSFRAYTTCDNGHKIEGVANYWSRYGDMSESWLNSIDYEPCEECELDNEEEDDDDF